MAIISSFGALQALGASAPRLTASPAGGSLSFYGSSQTYQAIYRAQPNVRTCVDFLSRNIAQLGLHVFRRVSDTDRKRLAGHELAGWLYRPNPATTRYRLFESLMIDLGIYFNAFWLKIRDRVTPGAPLGLVRLPPEEVEVEGVLMPTAFVWTPETGRPQRFAPSEIVHMAGGTGIVGLSPLETLRRVLAEESAAGDYRQSMWANASRIEGVIERPVTAPQWKPAQQQSWREQWQAAYANGGSRPGSVAVLEDGMTFRPISFSARESDYVAARKLTREECAAAYHIPQPFVGILDHATFSNIREQHKNLYQDTLGPWLEMIEEEVERQLLPECRDTRDVYVEFNIQDKLKGSFEEQATSLQQLVGRPVMTANEGRARLNLPRDPDPSSDTLAPQQGGPAAVRRTDSPADAAMTRTGPPAATTDDEDARVAPILQAHRARQRARLQKLPASDRAEAFALQIARWTDELTSDLEPIVGPAEAASVALATNGRTFAQLREEATYA